MKVAAMNLLGFVLALGALWSWFIVIGFTALALFLILAIISAAV